jgi:hypothetical protein
MNDEISVRIFRRKGAEVYYMEYIEPGTGKTVHWRNIRRCLPNILIHRAVPNTPFCWPLHDLSHRLAKHPVIWAAVIEAAAWERGDHQQGQQVRLLRTSECGRWGRCQVRQLASSTPACHAEGVHKRGRLTFCRYTD